jgi:hypothetical protein
LIRVGVGGPQACREDDWEVLEAPSEVRQEAERSCVAPVEIVDGQQHRSLAREVDHEPVEPVQPREHAFGRQVLVPNTLAEHGRRSLGGTREQARALGLRDEQRLEQLPHDAERKVSLELAAAGRTHGKVTLLGEHSRLGQ